VDKLHQYLKDPRNSLAREALVKNRLFYDVKLHFASKGRSLLAYEAEYDRDGFDVIFDELGRQRHFQVKSVLKSSSTASFYIHRNLLRPNIDELNYYPLSHDSFGVGYGGAVILVELEPTDESLNISYYYVDGLILSAFYAGILSYKSKVSQQSAVKSFGEFRNPRRLGGQIKLSKSSFVRLSSAGAIFGLSGFLGADEGNARFRVLQAVGRAFGLSQPSFSKVPFESLRDMARADFSKLIDTSKLQC